MSKYTLIGCLIFTAIAIGGEVNNGLNPKGTAKTLVLTEELRIGPDSGEPYDTWRGSWVAVSVNKEGHIFVLDDGDNRIIHYDPSGNFIAQMGRLGQGPGEFFQLRNFSVLDDNTSVAFDSLGGNDSFSYYDEQANFIKRKQLEKKPVSMQYAQLSPNGKLLSTFYFQPPESGSNNVRVSVLDADREELLVVSKGKVNQFNMSETVNPGWWVEYLVPWMELTTNNQSLIAFGQDSSVYTCNNNQYKITHYDPNMKEIKTINKIYNPKVRTDVDKEMIAERFRSDLLSVFPKQIHQGITNKVMNDAMKKANVSPRKATIFGLAPMPGGGLLVVSEHDWKTHVSKADLFDKDGILIGSVTLPAVEVNFFTSFYGLGAKIWFYGDKMYAVENVGDDLHVVRYSYKIQ